MLSLLSWSLYNSLCLSVSFSFSVFHNLQALFEFHQLSHWCFLEQKHSCLFFSGAVSQLRVPCCLSFSGCLGLCQSATVLQSFFVFYNLDISEEYRPFIWQNVFHWGLSKYPSFILILSVQHLPGLGSLLLYESQKELDKWRILRHVQLCFVLFPHRTILSMSSLFFFKK